MYGLVFVPPDGIQFEESLWTGRAGQLHVKMVPVQMGSNGHMGAGRPFMTPLNPAMINPPSGPHVYMKGCHVRWDGDLQGLRNGQRGSLLCLCGTDTRGSEPVLSDAWGMAWTQSQWEPVNVS